MHSFLRHGVHLCLFGLITSQIGGCKCKVSKILYLAKSISGFSDLSSDPVVNYFVNYCRYIC